MELRHLRYLVAIADAGTFVGAAAQLHVSQPVLTRRMHDLEDELGVPLFKPGARKATLTPAGDAAVRVARPVLQDAAAAVLRARLSSTGAVGKCVLASGLAPLASGLVSHLVGRMSARFPGITLVIEERSLEDQWGALERAEADIGLGLPAPASYASLISETQREMVMDHAVIPAGHPLASRSTVALADLRELPFLAIERRSADLDAAVSALVREMQRLSFPPARFPPREFPTIESLLPHIRAGQGWTLAPLPIVARLGGLAPVALSDFEAPLRIARIWRRADPRPVTNTVLSELRRMSREDARPGAPPERPEQRERVTDFVPARLDLRHLRSFCSVAEHGSLGRAAESMRITQPALSRQMRELEHDVGVPLFHRGTRGVELTPAGEVFLGDAKIVLATVDRLPRELRRAVRGTALRCVIGTVQHPYVERIIAKVIADLEGRQSRVRVGLRNVATPQQWDSLRAGDIDLAIGHAFPVPTPPPVSRGLIVVRIFDDRICTALVAADHSLAAASSVALKDLQDIPFLWPNRDFFPVFYDAVFEQMRIGGLRPRVDAEYDGLTTMWTLAARGLGWTLGWQSHGEQPPPGLRAIPLTDFTMSWGGVVIYRQDETRRPVFAAIDAIIAHAEALYGDVNPAGGASPQGHASQAVMS